MSNIALIHLGVLRAEGDKARDFLHGQLTCDVKKLPLKKACLGGYTNIKGRLLAVFYLLCLDENTFWIIMPREVIDSVKTVLARYAAFSRVRLTDISDEYPLSGVFSTQPLSEPFSINDDTLCLEGNRQICWKPPGDNPNPNIDIWVEADINTKMPWIFQNTQENVLPHYCSLVEKGGVNFEKGCYLGQEIIARMHYKGNIKKHGQIVSGLSTQATPGEEVLDAEDKVVGTILYGSSTMALCVLNDDAMPTHRKAQPEDALCIMSNQ